jgi:hypothetical protein
MSNIIIITTLEVDAILPGQLLIKTLASETEFGTSSRRQNRIATLDGKAILQDRGYSNTDLTFRISASKFNADQFDTLRYLLESYPEVRISTRIGSFIGSIKNLVDADSKFDFLVTRND